MRRGMLWLAIATFLASQALPVLQHGDRLIAGWQVTWMALLTLGAAGGSPTATSFLIILYFAGLGMLANLLFVTTLAALARGSRRAAIGMASIGLGAGVLCLAPIASFAASSLRVGTVTWIASLVALVVFTATRPMTETEDIAD